MTHGGGGDGGGGGVVFLLESLKKRVNTQRKTYFTLQIFWSVKQKDNIS